MDRTKVWRQKSGELVLIRHMTDRHIRNAIGMLRRKLIADDDTEENLHRARMGVDVLLMEVERRAKEPPLPGELEARMVREMEELLYDASRSSSQSPASVPSSSASTSSDPKS